VEDSLRRLGTDWIDLLQVHRLDPDTDVDETLSALTDLVRAGKVRTIGASTVTPSQLVEGQWVCERRGHERFRTEQPPVLRCSPGHRVRRAADRASATAWAC
jgi:aryl-alcohol dehydrogenase-like predicted oxidoreductase